MYATFPTGIPGLPPGQLFASTPYVTPGYSSGGPAGHGNSVGGQRLNFSASQLPHPQGSHHDSNEGSYSLQNQQVLLTVQTVYQQQLVLQSQLNQMCLAMQQMQTTLGQLVADPNRTQHSSTAYATASGGPRSGDPVPSASFDRFQSQGSSGQQWHGNNTSTTHSDTRRYSGEHHPLQQEMWDMDKATGDDGVDNNQSATPVSQVVPDAQQQGSRVLVDPPRRSPSKRGNATPSRPRAESPPPPALATTSPSRQQTTAQSVHVATPAASPPTPPSQPVVLTWDPKKYSRSSSAGSAHSQPHNVSHPLVPTPLHGGTPRQQSGTTTAAQQQQHPAADQSADSIASSQHAAPYASGGAGASFSDDRLSHPIVQQRQHAPPKILERVIGGGRQSMPLYPQSSASGRPPSGAAAGGAGPASTSYHDVSLSDDGYVSMDSAQYMQRFHLK